MTMEIREFTDFGNDIPARAIIAEYIGTLPFDVSFQLTGTELGDLSVFYSPAARGALLLAYEDGFVAGCVALKRLDESTCEMKRLYVRPQYRGEKIGRELVDHIIRMGKTLGYTTMKLDTDREAHREAIALYRRSGFREIARYNDAPRDFLFMELDLTHHTPMTPFTEKFHKHITPELSIIEFGPQHGEAFKALNVAWITKSFFMEESDEIVLSDPQTHILQGGGAILLAELNGRIVGTCALTYEGHDTYELTKMAVDESVRGMKIGWHLGVATLEKAKQLGGKKVILHSNTKGSAPAIQLYRKLGFTEIPLGDAPWARADIKMEFVL